MSCVYLPTMPMRTGVSAASLWVQRMSGISKTTRSFSTRRTQAFQDGVQPLRQFMLKNTRNDELALLIKVSRAEKPANADDVVETFVTFLDRRSADGVSIGRKP